MIRGVIFDLGGTLIARVGNWERANAKALRQWLLTGGYKIDEGFVEALVAEREAKFAARVGTCEVRAEEALHPVLTRYGMAVDPAFLVAAEAAFFEPELEAMRLLPGALELLESLDSRGLRLGLASNATSHYLIIECCHRLGLDRFLDPIVSSAAVGWGKPDPRIFEAILRQWSIAPEGTVMVGDTLEADIAGARQVGMRSILLTAEHLPDEPKTGDGLRADAEAATLPDADRIIARWLT